jgi:hypothetical protein
MAISFVAGASGLTNTVTIPAHAAGDLIVAVAFRDGSSTAPSLPADGTWTDVESPDPGTGGSTAGIMACKMSDGTAGAVTFANATSVAVAIYRGCSGWGDHAMTTGTGSPMTWPAVLLGDDGTSWVVIAASHRSGNTAIENPGSDWILRADSQDSGDETVILDTGQGETGMGGFSFAPGGTSSGWRTWSLQLVAAGAGHVALTGARVGTATPGDFYVGSTLVQRIYQGFDLIWEPRAVAPPASLDVDMSHKGASSLDLTAHTVNFTDQFTDSTKLVSSNYTIDGDPAGVDMKPVGSWFSPVIQYGAATFMDPDPAFRPSGKPNPFSYSKNAGSLTITMQNSGGTWQAGSCQLADWRYVGYTKTKGYWEMRAKFGPPDTKGPWYAFWLISQVDDNGSGVSERIEVDIIEAYGTDDGHHASLHVTISDQDPIHRGTGSNEVASLGLNMFDGAFHVYSCLITSDYIFYYMDGIELARIYIGDRPEFTRAKFYPIVSLAMNPDEVSQASGTHDMVVDYVKVWLPN